MIIHNSNGPAVLEHGGTCSTHFLVEKEALRAATTGGYLEFISDFRLEPGVSLEPHSHNSDEFYYVLEGAGTMTVDGEERDVSVGDLVHIPPNAIHSIRSRGENMIRSLAFAVSYMNPDEVGYTAYPPNGTPHFVRA